MVLTLPCNVVVVACSWLMFCSAVSNSATTCVKAGTETVKEVLLLLTTTLSPCMTERTITGLPDESCVITLYPLVVVSSPSTVSNGFFDSVPFVLSVSRC